MANPLKNPEPKKTYQEQCHEDKTYCGEEDCRSCCAHTDRDHGICIDCGHEQDMGFLIDMAEYTFDPER